jgi:hypothetical protein
MKILHTADLHLDSPLRGLDRYRGAPDDQVRGAVRAAFDNVVQTAINEQVALMLIAGDLYDGDWRDFHTALYLVKQLGRLKEAGVRVVVAGGNQDALSRLFAVQRLPDNVRVLSADHPETAVFDDLGVAVHGRSFKSADVTVDITPDYPEPVRDMLDFGMLHTVTEGFPGHAVFAPCRVSVLREKDYDYWALGHVHARQELARDPWIVYPGNIQGRSIAEAGPRGCALITVKDGRIKSVEHRDTDVVRWGVCKVDIAEAQTADEVLERFGKALAVHVAGCGGRLPIIRVQAVGAGPVHREFCDRPDEFQSEFRSAAHALLGENLWIERVVFDTAEEDLDTKLRDDEAVGGLIALIDRICADNGETDRLSAEFAALRAALPEEFLPAGGADWPGREGIRRALQDVKQFLVPRLLTPGGTA